MFHSQKIKSDNAAISVNPYFVLFIKFVLATRLRCSSSYDINALQHIFIGCCRHFLYFEILSLKISLSDFLEP